MINQHEELELRNRVTDLVPVWHDDHRGPVDAVEDDEAYLDLVRASSIVHEESDASLRRWVTAARRAGLSWEQVGSTLGVTRQAAQKRFSSEMHDPEQDASTPGSVIRTGVTAFNEVAVLDEMGADGYSVASTGFLKLRFERADGPVENVRMTSLREAPVVETMQADGWTHVSSWYPYTYFTRPVR